MLKQADSELTQIIVAEAFDDLCERYSFFSLENGDMVSRSHDQAEHSAMMVALVAFLLLANVYPEAKDHPYLHICQLLTDVAEKIVGYKEIYEEARQIEDAYESHGEFIEVADFIEQMAIRDDTLSSSEIAYARSVIGQIVEENSYFLLETMKDNEVILARVNDKNNHCFQPELNLLRDKIKDVEGGSGERLEYENIIFAPSYDDKISDIRNAIAPFVKDGPSHIDATKQNQWLAIIEPLKLIDGLLITHDDKPRRKECTDGEICQQMKVFFGDLVKSVDFGKIPKSISHERNVWKDRNVGLSFADWDRYINFTRRETKYEHLAKIAKSVYGKVANVIRG